LSALALKLALALTETGLQILGTSTCPTPAEVQAELEKSAAPSPTDPSSLGPSSGVAVVRLDQDASDGVLRIRFYDENGILQGAHGLPAEKDCRLLAVATATLLRSLELELDVAPAPLPIVAFDVRERRADSTSLELGAGGVGSLTADGQGGGGALLLGALTIRGSPFRPELFLQLEAPRQLALGTSEQGTWWRVWAAPGMQWRVLDGRHIWLSVHIEVPMGAVVASGTGFTNDEGGAAFELGASLGVRAGLRFLISPTRSPTALLPWLGLFGLGFLPHTLSVSGEANQASLPRLEAALGLGLSWAGR
jgi:hypothetical protein